MCSFLSVRVHPSAGDTIPFHISFVPSLGETTRAAVPHLRTLHPSLMTTWTCFVGLTDPPAAVETEPGPSGPSSEVPVRTGKDGTAVLADVCSPSLGE